MSKARFPWILAGVLVLAFAGGGVLGGILVSLVLAVIYLSSVRLNPRMRHGRCNGSGEHHSWLFPWVFRKCRGCNSGRIIRWGARQWGSDTIRAEAASARTARKSAKEHHTWR